MGEIVAIWIKRFKRGPMDRVPQAELVEGRGIAGNADQGGKRQVTIIDEAAWEDAQQQVGVSVPAVARRANLMLRGVDLKDSRGKHLRIGRTRIRIYGEVRPCSHMDAAREGLREALKPDWRGGAFGEIVEGGTIRVGDVAEWSEE